MIAPLGGARALPCRRTGNLSAAVEGTVSGVTGHHQTATIPVLMLDAVIRRALCGGHRLVRPHNQRERLRDLVPFDRWRLRGTHLVGDVCPKRICALLACAHDSETSS